MIATTWTFHASQDYETVIALEYVSRIDFEPGTEGSPVIIVTFANGNTLTLRTDTRVADESLDLAAMFRLCKAGLRAYWLARLGLPGEAEAAANRAAREGA